MAGRYANTFIQQEENLLGIGTVPTFAIGQRALLVRTPNGNVLWDCISLLDDATVTTIKAMGGLAAIAISHPHFYTTMVEWSRAFDAPVHLHAADRQWVMRGDPGAQILGRRDDGIAAGPHADPRRRSLQRRHHAALGGRRGREGRAARRRHRDRDSRTGNSSPSCTAIRT